MDKFLSVAKKAALQGGKLFYKSFGKATGVHAKNQDKRNIVTDSDIAIEKIIRKQISQTFPEHLILGEEFGGKTEIKKGEYIWIIDPIDGTNNFAQGIPLACISIGLWDYKGPLAAVVYNPITKEMYTAARGKGAFLNKKKISPSNTSDPQKAFGGIGWTKGNVEKSQIFLMADNKFGKARTFGSTTLQVCFVADGRMDFYFAKGIYIWDLAAAALIASEAGAKITDFSGKPLNLTSREVIASNGEFHSYIIKNLR